MRMRKRGACLEANTFREAGQYKRQKTETPETKAPQKPEEEGYDIFGEINDLNEANKSKDAPQAPVNQRLEKELFEGSELAGTELEQ
jgi:hypothetical protein